MALTKEGSLGDPGKAERLGIDLRVTVGSWSRSTTVRAADIAAWPATERT